MFSGYLQAGAYSGLDGKYGKQGWQVGLEKVSNEFR